MSTLVLPGKGNEFKVTVNFKDGGFIQGGYLFNWDAVDKPINNIEIQHPNVEITLTAEEYLMYNEVIMILGAGKLTCLCIAERNGDDQVAQGYRFVADGRYGEESFNLLHMHPDTLKLIMKK